MGEPFKAWVETRISDRNKKVTQEKNLDIELDEDVARVFKSSNAVSVNAGSGHALMKITSKRRRTK